MCSIFATPAFSQSSDMSWRNLDVSPASATASFPGSVGRPLKSIISDTKNIKNYGAKLDDSQLDVDKAIIDNLWSTKPRVVELPTGITWPHSNGHSWIPNSPQGNIVVNAHGEVNWWPSYAVTDYGIGFPIPDFGDGVTSILYGANAAIAVSRVDNDNIGFNTSLPNIAFNYMADTTKEHGSAGAPGMLNINIHSVAGKNKRGMMAGVNDVFDSLSHGYYGDDDVQNWHHMGIWGTDWTWSNIREVNQFIPFYFSTKQDGYYNQATYVNEEDFSSGGPENAASAYDPTAANRKMFWLNSGYGTMGGGHLDANGHKVSRIAPAVKWKAYTPYHRYQEIIVADSTGQPWLFYGLNKNYSTSTGVGGTEDTLSGSSEPAWKFINGTTTTDGDIIWRCIGPFTVDFGTIIGVSGENDPKTGWIARIGTLMEEDTNYIYNAIFDMSKAAFDPNVTHIFARMQKDMYLDLTANGTKAGQNNHLLGYSNDGTGFGYKLSPAVNGTKNTTTPFHVTDDGVTHISSLDVGSKNDVLNLSSGRQIVKAEKLDGGLSGHSLSLRYADSNVHLFVDGVDFGSIQTNKAAVVKSKRAILAITNPQEGQSVYDIDDHAEVTYRCPTRGSCGWFPVQYGAALRR